MQGEAAPLDLNHICIGRYDFYVGLVVIAANPRPKNTLLFSAYSIGSALFNLGDAVAEEQEMQEFEAELRQDLLAMKHSRRSMCGAQVEE